MKNFSAESCDHREFSLIEFRSELEALELINSLPSHVKLLDMFSLTNGHFVVFLICQNLKNVYDSLKKHPSALDGYFTNDTIIESLNAFYYLNKTAISDCLLIIESEKLSQIFSIMDLAHRSDLHAFDLKNQKAHKFNTLYLSGKLEHLKKFENNLKSNSEIQYKIIEHINKPLSDFLN